jgi:hypothetical protein
MCELGIRAVFLLQPSEPCAVSVVLVFAICRKNIFVESSQLLEGDRVNREARISHAGNAALEAEVSPCATDDIALPMSYGSCSEFLDVSGCKRNIVVRDQNRVGFTGKARKHSVVPTPTYTPVHAVGVIEDTRSLGEPSASIDQLRPLGVQEYLALHLVHPIFKRFSETRDAGS